MMVIPQRIPDSYVRSTVTDSVQDRLFSISDQILSRSRLERIITELDLYPEERRINTMEDVVGSDAPRKSSCNHPGREQSFRVSYTSVDPLVAQKVTARLASMFIEENTRERESLAENTSVFLESQLEDAKVRLQEQEKKLEAYRLANSGELPSQLTSNLQGIQNARMQLQSDQRSDESREGTAAFDRAAIGGQAPLTRLEARLHVGSTALVRDAAKRTTAGRGQSASGRVSAAVYPESPRYSRVGAHHSRTRGARQAGSARASSG